MNKHLVHPLRECHSRSRIGTKAKSLLLLAGHGFTIPASWVCTWDAYENYLADDTAVIAALQADLETYIDEGGIYAVRSSANLEDGFETSFAGQFRSVLNVRGIDEITSAIWSIWATARGSGIRAYIEQHAVDPDSLRMAVLIQEMVPPSISGVVFSRDPMTGEPVQIIEAVRGSGEQLMRGGITPERWIRAADQWREMPDAPILPRSLAADITSQAAIIERAVGYPADIEWVYDGSSLYWVQLREVTTLRNAHVYSNRIAREYMPGVILPLVWSVNVPLVNGAWIELITELIGPNSLTPEKLAQSIRYHAYFNMSALGDIFEQLGLPHEFLERIRDTSASSSGDRSSFRPTLKMVRFLPRLLSFVIDKLRFERNVKPFLQQAQIQYRGAPTEQLDDLSVEELLSEIEKLSNLNRRTAYFNVVIPILMQIFDGVFKKRLAKLNIPTERLDLRGDSPDFSRLDPAPAIRNLKTAYDQLPVDVRGRLMRQKTRAFRTSNANTPVAAFEAEFRHFLEDFGHLSDNGNDFSSPRWWETPDLMLELVMDYEDIERDRDGRPRFEDLEMPFLKRRRLRHLKSKVQRYMLYREKIGSLYTYGQNLFRIYFLALGRKLTAAGCIERSEDIFYLQWNEILDWAQGSPESSVLDAYVRRRQVEVAACRDLEMPEIIYGDVPPPPVNRSRPAQALNGTPTSPGRYRGPACIVRGIRDFAKVQPGDVLVVPFTDVGWTPLFTKAGAVVAESGGMLSHSSIVAREYEIPAVVSVNHACKLIADGAIILVDGYHGRVFLEDDKAQLLEMSQPKSRGVESQVSQS
jgi:pyruvate,water dikinase